MVNHSPKLIVGVIFGGRSGEYEVSLMSARSVLSALDKDKYALIQIWIKPDGSWWTGENILESLLVGEQPVETEPVAMLPDPTRPGLHRLPGLGSAEHLDVIFPVLHGTFGEDGTLQGVLEMMDIAYVGAGVLGSALGMDKAVFKEVMRAMDIPVVEHITVLRSVIETEIESVLRQAEQAADYPLFVKPANLGSSVGITKCLNRSDLMEGLIEASYYDRKVLIESGLNAREIEVSILGNDHPIASVPGEILPSREYYSYEAKYIDGDSALIIPAPLSPELTQRVQELALKAYKAVDCAGMARADFLLEKNPTRGEGLYLSEINTIPGFTTISMYPKLWEASGLPYPALLDRLIELALERKSDRDRSKYDFHRDR
jgi:D-alanine-D-alanine ligase